MTRRQRTLSKEQRYRAWRGPSLASVRENFGPVLATFLTETDLCAIRGNRRKLARMLAAGDGRRLDRAHRLYGHYMALASRRISQMQRKIC